MEVISIRQARRLALARSGLLRPRLTDLPERAVGRGQRARQRCHRIIERFGYLQLDSVSVSGARSHGIVLASRLRGLESDLAETLLSPGEPLFEYWGHEASWIPIELYPCFGFRRQAFRVHPWWGDLLAEHPRVAADLLGRIRTEGPLRSADLEGSSGPGWWNLKLAKRIAEALWSAGELAVSARRGFLRSFDLAERVIPAAVRDRRLSQEASFDRLLLIALAGHGWATTGTLSATWRLRNCRQAVVDSLERLCEQGLVQSCALDSGTRRIPGWITPRDLEQAADLERLRPSRSNGVLLSPFDPLLWDRARTLLLFDFEQTLEIYKPAALRVHGYYCLPLLAGERLVGRVDLKAERAKGLLKTLSCHYEHTDRAGKPSSVHQQAMACALQRFAGSVKLRLADPTWAAN